MNPRHASNSSIDQGGGKRRAWRRLLQRSRANANTPAAELFDKGESRHQIGKAPPIIVFAAPQNYASMSQLKVSRFVELDDLTVQRNVQSSNRDRDLNVIRVRSLVSVPDRFHVYAPIPHDGFGVDYVSKMWLHEKLSVVGGGKRRFRSVLEEAPSPLTDQRSDALHRSPHV